MENKCDKVTTRGGRCISVIVPVYKVEPYLRCCIDSILAQTFTDFELILIDDGSPDNCGAICDEYAAKDDRIVVIHQENAGVSAARNAGLDWVFTNSDSAWVTFVDSDDAIVPVYLEHLYKYAINENADVATTCVEIVAEDSEMENAPQHIVSTKSVDGRDCCVSFYCDGELLTPYPFGKLIKKCCLINKRFTIGISYAEDEEFVIKLIYDVSKVVVLQSWLYCYRQRENSAVHRPVSLWMYDKLKVIDSCILFFEKYGDAELKRLAEHRKKYYAAKCMLLAHGAGMKHSVPRQYRMSVLRAVFIIAMETLKDGTISHFRVRLDRFRKKCTREPRIG